MGRLGGPAGFPGRCPGSQGFSCNTSTHPLSGHRDAETTEIGADCPDSPQEMQPGDRLSRNKERGRGRMSEGVHVGRGLRKIRHARRRRKGGGVRNDADTLKTGDHLCPGQTAMLQCGGIRPYLSPSFRTEPLARRGLGWGGGGNWSIC